MRVLAVVVCAGCAVAVPSLPADHPANPRAPTGRLAGPPATLRPGVVTYSDVPVHRDEPSDMHHHHHP